MIRDNLTWETNSTLSYPSGNEGRVLRYEEDWHTVSLVLTDYTATSTIAVSDREFTIRGLEGEDWKPLTPEARKRYLDLRIGELRPVAAPFLFRLSGTADIGRRDTINVVHIANAPFPRSSGSSAPGFKARFEKVEVTIVGGDADQRGILRYDKQDDFGPDRLSLEFVIHRDKMRQLLADIRARDQPPRLEISANILLFVDEVHSALKDYWMPDDFVVPADPGTAAASLVGVTVNWGRIPADIGEDERTEGNNLVESQTDPHAETNQLLKGIKTAVWALFGVVAAAAVLHLR
ncbi:hypothetical protein AMK06_CH02010 [Rhizobium sp. N541]|uniref:hypothetical protein n=1 Tax=unclassified Rhizobium TaxID=2613769 RepID=UPI0007EE54F6|nr:MULTISPECIES: hypothetical protein [unclassified Rhizobium]ANM16910.1 hypothetical protein AMK06_CH02010 [Rhizobium sp. N541]ANM23295.1 hypothetical protein AMK07_CH02007 [Rhizobium sp. N941]